MCIYIYIHISIHVHMYVCINMHGCPLSPLGLESNMSSVRWAAEHPKVKCISCHPGWTDTPGVEAAYGGHSTMSRTQPAIFVPHILGARVLILRSISSHPPQLLRLSHLLHLSSCSLPLSPTRSLSHSLSHSLVHSLTHSVPPCTLHYFSSTDWFCGGCVRYLPKSPTLYLA